MRKGIKGRSTRTSHNFFKIVSERYERPFDGNPGQTPEIEHRKPEILLDVAEYSFHIMHASSVQTPSEAGRKFLFLFFDVLLPTV